MKFYIIILGLVSTMLIAGCTSQTQTQQVTKYVCPDGSTVSDASLCPKLTGCLPGDGSCPDGWYCSLNSVTGESRCISGSNMP